MDKVGILLCNSRVYPQMMFDINGGINSRLKKVGIDSSCLIIESIGHGGDHRMIIQKAEQLLLNPSIKVLVVFADSIIAKKIEPIVNASGKILISADFGAQIPGLAVPTYQHLSFSLQTSYGIALSILEQLKNGAKKFSYISSFFDSGYSQVYGAYRMWEKNGGELTYQLAFPIKPPIDILDYIAIDFEQNKPDAIVLQFCEESWNEFYSMYRNKHLPHNLPVCVSSMLLERDWTLQQPYYFEKAKGYVCWDKNLVNKENTEFNQIIESYTGKQASIFHLLGWDAGSLLIKVLDELKKTHNPVEIVKNVAAMEFESPRGTIVWNEKFKQFVSPMYEMSIEDNSGFCLPNHTGKVFFDEVVWEEFAGDIPSQFSRWYNSYPCPT